MSFFKRMGVSADANLLKATVDYKSKMIEKVYFFETPMFNCLSGAYRISGVYGVTAGEARRARPGKHRAYGKTTRMPFYTITEGASE